MIEAMTEAELYAPVEWRDCSAGYEDILYHKSQDGIAKITINRPQVRNAFRPRTVKEMLQALADARYDDKVGTIILTGFGEKAFCAGGDFEDTFERGAGSAVPGIPTNAQPFELGGINPGQSFEQTLDILAKDVAIGDFAHATGERPVCCQFPELLDIGAEERPAKKYHLEAIIIGGIVAASYLNAAVHLFG